MRLRIGPSLLGVALIGAASLAFLQRPSAARSPEPAPLSSNPPRAALEDDRAATPLPPNHPPISPKSTDPSAFARDESPAELAWTAPGGWEVAPNRSPMRLVTYRVPAAPGAVDGAELTVTRAGGTTAANLERWVAQFDGAGRDMRGERVIGGFRVATVEVSGTYEGGMTKSGPDTAHPAWSLLGAVVETSGPSYFFKLVGPTATVRAARPGFDALLRSIRKTP